MKITLLTALLTISFGAFAQSLVVSPIPSYNIVGSDLVISWDTPTLPANYSLAGCRVFKDDVPQPELYQVGEDYVENPIPVVAADYSIKCEGFIRPLWEGEESTKITFTPSPTDTGTPGDPAPDWSVYDNTPVTTPSAPVIVTDGDFNGGQGLEFQPVGGLDNGFTYAPTSFGTGSFFSFDLKISSGQEWVIYLDVITNLGNPLTVQITNRPAGERFITGDAVAHISPTWGVGTRVEVAVDLNALVQAAAPGETFASIDLNQWRVDTGVRIDRVKQVNYAVPTDQVDPPVGIPTAPSNLRYSNLAATSFTLDWDASTDSDGQVVQYFIYVDDVYVGSTGSLSYAVTGLTEDIEVSMTVRGVDNDGQEGALSNPLLVTPTAGAPPGGTDGMTNLASNLDQDDVLGKAFPGAVGVGRNTRGGRTTGVQHLIVNTTATGRVNSGGNLSLQSALETGGPKIISFSVGGLFEPQNDSEGNPRFYANSDTTVLCSTAPAPGVIMYAEAFIVKRKTNYLERGCIHAAQDNGGAGVAYSPTNSARGLTISGGGTNNIMIDHSTIMWGPDENLVVYNFGGESPLQGVTVQNSLIIEGDVDSSHSGSLAYPAWGSHGQGPNCNTSDNDVATERGSSVTCTLAYNFIGNSTGRNPGCLGGYCDFVSNITYNGFSDHTQFQGNDHFWRAELLWKNNLLKKGPSYSPSDGFTKLATIASANAYLTDVNNRQVELGAAISSHTALSTGRTESLGLGLVYQNTPTLDSIGTLAQNQDYLNCRGAHPHSTVTGARVIGEFQATGAFTLGWPTPGGSAAGGTVGIAAHLVPGNGSPVGPGNWFDFTGPGHTYPASHNLTDQRAPEITANSWNSDGTLSNDADGDTMDDTWETNNGLNTGINDALSDLDGDGYLNIEEYVSDLLRCDSAFGVGTF